MGRREREAVEWVPVEREAVEWVPVEWVPVEWAPVPMGGEAEAVAVARRQVAVALRPSPPL